jgi:hypothetical protein
MGDNGVSLKDNVTTKPSGTVLHQKNMKSYLKSNSIVVLVVALLIQNAKLGL